MCASAASVRLSGVAPAKRTTHTPSSASSDRALCARSDTHSHDWRRLSALAAANRARHARHHPVSAQARLGVVGGAMAHHVAGQLAHCAPKRPRRQGAKRRTAATMTDERVVGASRQRRLAESTVEQRHGVARRQRRSCRCVGRGWWRAKQPLGPPSVAPPRALTDSALSAHRVVQRQHGASQFARRRRPGDADQEVNSQSQLFAARR